MSRSWLLYRLRVEVGQRVEAPNRVGYSHSGQLSLGPCGGRGELFCLLGLTLNLTFLQGLLLLGLFEHRGGARVSRNRLAKRKLALQVAVEAVLDGVVGAALDLLRNFGPFVSELGVELQNFAVLLSSPLLLGEVGVQVIDPALTALLADAARHKLGNLGPVAAADLTHDDLEALVLVGGPPVALEQLALIVELEPPLVALDLTLAGDVLANTVPVGCAELGDQLGQKFVLKGLGVALLTCSGVHSARYLGWRFV